MSTSEQEEREIREHERRAVLDLVHATHDGALEQCRICRMVLQGRQNEDLRPAHLRLWGRVKR